MRALALVAVVLLAGCSEPAVNTSQSTLVAPAAVEQPMPKRIWPKVEVPSPKPVVNPTQRVVRRASRSRTSIPGVLARIRGCESGSGPSSPGNYRAENSRSTASGAYQFLDGTWRSTTGLKPPASAYPPAVQDAAALTLYRRSGTRPWNASRHCWG